MFAQNEVPLEEQAVIVRAEFPGPERVLCTMAVPGPGTGPGRQANRAAVD
jgi:hypothetical protein